MAQRTRCRQSRHVAPRRWRSTNHRRRQLPDQPQQFQLISDKATDPPVSTRTRQAGRQRAQRPGRSTRTCDTDLTAVRQMLALRRSTASTTAIRGAGFEEAARASRMSYTYTPSRATRGESAITQKRHINCVRDSDHELPGDVRRHRTGLQRFRQPVLESNTGSDLLSPPRHVQAPGQHKGIPRQKRMRVQVARSSRSSATTREQRHAGWLSQYWPVTRGPVPRWTGTVHTHTHTHTLPASIDSRSVLPPTHTRTHVPRLGRR